MAKSKLKATTIVALAFLVILLLWIGSYITPRIFNGAEETILEPRLIENLKDLRPIVITSLPWTESQEYKYEVYSTDGMPNRQMEFKVQVAGDQIHLKINELVPASKRTSRGIKQQAFDAKLTEEAWLNLLDGTLLAGKSKGELTTGGYESDWDFDGQIFTVTRERTENELTTKEIFELVIGDEEKESIITTVWTLSALPFSFAYEGRIKLFISYAYREETDDMGPILEELAIKVLDLEEIKTPAGTFEAWKVNIDGDLAWYSVNAPYPLIKYESPHELLLLTEL